MISLGVLNASNPDVFGESRRKLLRLAEALGFDTIAATRLATVFSELGRIGLAGGGLSVEVSLDDSSARPALYLVFSFASKVDIPAGTRRFFDSMGTLGAFGGPSKFEAVKLLPRYDFHASRSFLEVQREMLSRPSRAELFHDLQAKNEMLENLSSKLAKYLSPQIFDSIFSGGKDVVLSTDRKKLTVFFSDIKNFTLTTDDLQPEDLTFLLNSYFTHMSAIALEYGATIDKFIGDAMLMFFGDPQTKGVEEDAKACVRMAVAMQRKMAELEEQWRKWGVTKPLQMRIGINTGYCNVGNFGSESRMDYTIIGGEVNLAARLEASGDPGGILMSYETYALTKDIVTCEERPPLQVKGIRREVRNFAVLDILGAKPDGPDRFLRLDMPGLRLVADREKLTGAALDTAVADLESLAEELRQAPGEA